MVDEDRGKVAVDLGAGIGEITLWFPFGARRKLKQWLEDNRPRETFGAPTELSLIAYFWAGMLWNASKLKLDEVESMLDKSTTSTLELTEAVAGALFVATTGETYEEWLAKREKLPEEDDPTGSSKRGGGGQPG